MPGIYVHLPFCPYICPYCDFAKWPYRKTPADRYFEALMCEIDVQPTVKGETVFLGGGTPNTYAPERVGELLAALHRRFPGPSNRETTIEVNPELVRAQDLPAYRRAGVTRLSIGVQSFDAQEIRTLGRRHTADEVTSVVAFARDAGIGSVSLDLIFGVPGQSPPSWRKSWTPPSG